MKLSEEQIKRVQQMRAEKITWKAIGRYFHCRAETIRSQVDPEYKRYRREQLRVAEARRRATMLGEEAEIREGINERQRWAAIPRFPAYDPRRDGLLVWESLDAYLTGCPPIGRRALDRKELGTTTS